MQNQGTGVCKEDTKDRPSFRSCQSPQREREEENRALSADRSLKIRKQRGSVTSMVSRTRRQALDGAGIHGCLFSPCCPTPPRRPERLCLSQDKGCPPPTPAHSIWPQHPQGLVRVVYTGWSQLLGGLWAGGTERPLSRGEV